MIHLNASDERGIDIIRNQINQFVNSKSLFVNGIKFVILDEVDYMTKNAQQALKYLLQGYDNIRFCLICNYLSKIDISLQNEFLRLRFNQLPQNNIIKFLNKINKNESLNLSNKILISIQSLFKSDIRSMINYMQLNHNNLCEDKILDNNVWIELINILKTEKNISKINKHIDNIILNYNIELSNLLKSFFNYFIRNNPEKITNDLLVFIEFIIRINNNSDNYMKNYFIIRIKKLI